MAVQPVETPVTDPFRSKPGRWNLPEELIEFGDALIEELIAAFVSNTSDYLTRLTDLLSEGDFVGVRVQTHRIKGAASQMGATAMTLVCQELEDPTRPRTAAELETLVAQLRAAFADVCADMAAFPGVSR